VSQIEVEEETENNQVNQVNTDVENTAGNNSGEGEE